HLRRGSGGVTTMPFVEELREVTAPAGVPAWLAERRRVALARLASNGFPTQKNEDWRYTNVQPILEANFPVAGPDVSHGVTADALDPFRFAQDWPLAVFVNGRFEPELSELDALPD